MNQQTPEEMEIARRRKLADALGSMAMQRSPSGQMVGRVFVGTHPLEHIAKALQAYGSYKINQNADTDAKALGEKRNAALIEGLRGFQQKMTGTPEKVAPYQAPSFDDADAATMQGNQTVTPAVPADPRAAYAGLIGSQVPMLQQMGVQGMGQLPQIEAQKADRADARAFRGAEAEANRQARVDQLNMQHQMRMEQMAAQNASKEQMLQAQQQHQMALKQMGASIAAGMRQPRAPVAVMGPDGKPVYVSPEEAIGKSPASKTGENKLPTTALKMQNEELDAFSTAGGVIADTAALQKQIETGALKLGPVQNLASKGKNAVGMSDPNSQNFAAFKSGIEKLRNDSLRLNKGVQTEGDAVRAMDELMSNINDPKVVARQLARINEINQRAMNLRKMNIEAIRNNFGVDPMDFTQYEKQPAATGAPQSGGFKILGVK